MPDVESTHMKMTSVRGEMLESQSNFVFGSRDEDQEEPESWITLMRRYEGKVEGRNMKQRQRTQNGKDT